MAKYTVDFITFCHPKLLERFHAPDVYEEILDSHNYDFDGRIVIHQRCQGMEYRPFGTHCRIIESENYPHILSEFNIPEFDPIADEVTHGPSASHYWKWHTINHAIGLKESRSDYIVFSDCDCYIRDQREGSWVNEAVRVMRKYDSVFIVSPGDGAQMFEGQTEEGYRLTKNVSQQLFLCDRRKLLAMNWDEQWDGNYDAPGGPFQEYYYMLEGRIWRHLDKYNQWRCILPDSIVRYWHNQW